MKSDFTQVFVVWNQLSLHYGWREGASVKVNQHIQRSYKDCLVLKEILIYIYLPYRVKIGQNRNILRLTMKKTGAQEFSDWQRNLRFCVFGVKKMPELSSSNNPLPDVLSQLVPILIRSFYIQSFCLTNKKTVSLKISFGGDTNKRNTLRSLIIQQRLNCQQPRMQNKDDHFNSS